MRDIIEISNKVAEALSIALGQDFNRVEQPERMAWVILVMKKLPDSEVTFPHGKWATIQAIENQLERAACDKVLVLLKKESHNDQPY